MSDIDDNKIRRLDGTLLLVLRELLRQRRTTVVADRLGMSQSAVSHALKRLRSIFDDPLFTRRPHGLEPTRFALDLAPKVESLLAAMADVVGADDDFTPSESTRDFAIGAPDHVSTLVAPALVAAIMREAPQVRLAFSQHIGTDALDAVRRGSIDVAIGRFGRRTGRELHVEPLFDDRYCLVARRGHPRLKSGLSPTGYAALDHVQISVSGDLRIAEIERFAPAAPARRTVASVPRFPMAFTIVAASDAVTLAPRRLAEQFARSMRLSIHELPFETEPIRVVTVRREQPDAGVQWLVGQITAVGAPADAADA